MILNLDLPGLERLLKVCRDEKISHESFSPAQRPLAPGTLIHGLPVDPLLAAVYHRLGGLYTDSFIDILRYDDSLDEFADVTREIHAEERLPFKSFLIFGKKSGLSYYYGTLPALADEAGRQPVFELDAYLEPCAIPVASSVDRFFNLYARYLELLVREGRLDELAEVPEFTFPWGVPHLVAEDEPLVELIRLGRIEPWVPRLEPEQSEVRKWMSRVLTAHG